MVIAWLMAASIGVLMPRYMKRTWVGKQIMKKDRWFVVSLGIITVSVTFITKLISLVSSSTYDTCLDFDRGRIHHHLCRRWWLGIRVCL